MPYSNQHHKRDAQSKPLFRRIQGTLSDRIAQGEWKPGEALPSRVQLCEEFCTTRVTLDKAIHGLIDEGLLRSSKGNGTVVNSTGVKGSTRNLPRTIRIGVIAERETTSPGDEEFVWDDVYGGPILQGVRNAVSGKPIDTVFANLHRTEYQAFYQQNALDGMILIAPSLNELPTLHSLMEMSIPFVAIGISSDNPLDAMLPCVDTNNRQGAIDAVRHLVELGHQRIAIVNLATSNANLHDRLMGYKEALTTAGLPIIADDLVFFPTHIPSRFEGRVEEWLAKAQASGSLPTAILVCDYQMTLATLAVLRRHGLSVPDDISIVGFDDPLSATGIWPRLTTVRQPVYHLGLRAAERLIESLQNEAHLLTGVEILPNELIIRDSTASPKTV